MVCQECGRIELLHDTRLDRMLRRVAQRVPMRSAVCELTVYGLCHRCSD
ncbi:hypothetical protein [Baekduia soli]|nr:hypothetical protein [Baekduia soli]